MIRIDAAVEIKRPLEEVWAYFADPRNRPEWASTTLEANASEMPLRKASKISLVVKLLGRRIDTTVEVTEYEVSKRFGVRMTTPFPFEATYTFERLDGGTRVREVGEGEPRGFFKLADPILGRIVQRQSQGDLETLKEVLEARVPTGVTG